MRGTILGYDAATGEGVITDTDGRRIAFVRTEWKSPGEPLPGRLIDFQAEGDRATGIFVVPGTAGALSPTDQDPLQRATIYGSVSLACAIFTYLIGPFGLFTLIPAVIFGFMGRNAGRALPDRTGYYLSVAGLVLSAIAIVIGLIITAMFAGFVGLIGWIGSLH